MHSRETHRKPSTENQLLLLAQQLWYDPVAMTFDGMTVIAFESRMATEIGRLIERYGGRPLIVPVLREVLLEDNSAAQEFGVRLMAGRVDVLILLTGVGATSLFDLLKTRYPGSSVVQALKDTPIIARGPKPVAALKAVGLQATVMVPEPGTLALFAAGLGLVGLRRRKSA